VFDVQQGMTERQVTALAGSPATLHENCWFYRASKAGTSIDGITFCFAGGRVATIQTATHL
jgi:outer membrane protein assembly factor BamE (lipoprotein component of BamABCDE complex)